jgi:hypothetical protein
MNQLLRPAPTMPSTTGLGDSDFVIGQPFEGRGLVFKHSPTGGLGAFVYEEVADWLERLTALAPPAFPELCGWTRGARSQRRHRPQSDAHVTNSAAGGTPSGREASTAR